MSRIFKATLPCNKCNNEFEATLFSTIRGVYAHERAQVFNDEAIKPTCPNCQNRAMIGNLSIMYHDAEKMFAIWYEPMPDPHIDAQMAEMKKMTMGGGYLAEAPRITDWEEFKATILKYESGELKAAKADEMKEHMESRIKELFGDQKKQKKSGGCMLSFLGLIFASVYCFV